jgi:TPP-dependent trihydroxycyclohexane-1,2-dione (THcHDO) dehydratase
MAAMRVLTDPAETGAVTLALPQDVQAEAYEWLDELFDKRVWHVARPVPEPATLSRAVDTVRSSSRPLIVAGGGVIYSRATDALRTFVEATGIPVAETQAGKGSLPYDHPQSVGALGATGTAAANALAGPTSSSVSAPVTATSRRRLERCSSNRASGSSTSTSRRSTRASSPECRSSPTRDPA